MNIGTYFKTKVDLHWSAAILILLSASRMFSYLNLAYAGMFSEFSFLVASTAFSVGLIFSIIAHEFGHILVGRKHGVEFTGITIHFLGGAAHMNPNIPNAKAELWMAAAGPAVSVALFILLLPIAMFYNYLFPTHILVDTVIAATAIVNLALAIFNLIPAYPLDGGRILRSIFWLINKNFLKATRWATYVGDGFGAAFVITGVMMMFGVKIPLFGQGIGDGIWQVVMGALIIIFANYELNQYKRDYAR